MSIEEPKPVRLVGDFAEEIITGLFELVEQLKSINENLARIATEAERDYP